MNFHKNYIKNVFHLTLAVFKYFHIRVNKIYIHRRIPKASEIPDQYLPIPLTMKVTDFTLENSFA